MAKSPARVKAKMENNVRTGGTEMRAGMQASAGPEAAILANPANSKAKWLNGLAEAQKKDSWLLGVQKSANESRWKNAAPKAAQNWESQSGVMVENYMKGYSARMAIQEQADTAVQGMPDATIQQRLAKASARALKVSELSKAGKY
ncbi:MAG: hypothetical protein PHW03_09400 [Eubacteriales bacterium]|nr:hypothetical protein [Eubacteriales bacterium]